MGCVKRIWYLSPMRAAKVQVSLRIRAVSPEPPLLAHTSNESRGTFRQKARSLAPLNGWACAVKICHDGMLEDTNSLDGAQILRQSIYQRLWPKKKKNRHKDIAWYLYSKHRAQVSAAIDLAFFLCWVLLLSAKRFFFKAWMFSFHLWDLYSSVGCWISYNLLCQSEWIHPRTAYHQYK